MFTEVSFSLFTPICHCERDFFPFDSFGLLLDNDLAINLTKQNKWWMICLTLKRILSICLPTDSEVTLFLTVFLAVPRILIKRVNERGKNSVVFHWNANMDYEKVQKLWWKLEDSETANKLPCIHCSYCLKK